MTTFDLRPGRKRAKQIPCRQRWEESPALAATTKQQHASRCRGARKKRRDYPNSHPLASRTGVDRHPVSLCSQLCRHPSFRHGPLVRRASVGGASHRLLLLCWLSIARAINTPFSRVVSLVLSRPPSATTFRAVNRNPATQQCIGESSEVSTEPSRPSLPSPHECRPPRENPPCTQASSSVRSVGGDDGFSSERSTNPVGSLPPLPATTTGAGPAGGEGVPAGAAAVHHGVDRGGHRGRD